MLLVKGECISLNKSKDENKRCYQALIGLVFVIQCIRVVGVSATSMLLESKDALLSKSYSFKMRANLKCWDSTLKMNAEQQEQDFKGERASGQVDRGVSRAAIGCLETFKEVGKQKHHL